MLLLPPGYESSLGPVEHQLPAVLLVNLVDRVAHLALQAVEPCRHAPQLVLEPEHVLDAREVEPELGRQPLDQPQPLEVSLRVEARVAGRALRLDEPLPF